jgi:hypothetical protein
MQTSAREESAVAGASQNATPRVAVVPSSFRGSQDHDGTRVSGLHDPRPLRSALTRVQVEGMLLKAVELSATRRGPIEALFGADDWVVVLCGAAPCLKVVEPLVAYLARRKAGARFTFSSTACDSICEPLSRACPNIRFEACNLSSEDKIEVPIPWTRGRRRTIPQTLQRCDKVISVAPLRTASPITPTLANYLGAVQSMEAAEAAVDLASVHPAEYTVVGGDCNILIAGAKPVAVDAIASAILGHDPQGVPCLALATRRGLGICDPDTIWIRGAEIADAARQLREARI